MAFCKGNDSKKSSEMLELIAREKYSIIQHFQSQQSVFKKRICQSFSVLVCNAFILNSMTFKVITSQFDKG